MSIVSQLVKQMRVGERSRFHITLEEEEYLFNCKLPRFFMLDCKIENALPSDDIEKLVNVATTLKNSGNAFFASKTYDKSCNMYEQVWI